MTTEAERPDDEDRWTQLVESEVCGELSEAERVELDRLSALSEERRQERLVLAGMAKSPPLVPEGSPADERLIEAALAQHARQGRRRRAAVWLAAGILVPVAAVAAVAAAYLPRSKDAHPTAGSPPPALVLPAAPSAAPAPARDLTGHDTDHGATVPAVSSERVPPPAGPFASRTSSPSPAELLARAQRARSARDYAAAIRAYRLLLRVHPASDEAPLALLSLAQLQLASGDANGALAGFEAYERSRGALSQEAHYGKIQALRALGRTAEESAEIRRFTARYPDSLQAAALRQRIGAGGDQK